MVADEQGFRRGQLHLVITAGVTPFLAGNGVGEVLFGLKAPGQVIGQKKGADRDFQGPFRHPALADDRHDVVFGRAGDALIDPGRGPTAAGRAATSSGLFEFFPLIRLAHPDRPPQRLTSHLVRNFLKIENRFPRRFMGRRGRLPYISFPWSAGAGPGLKIGIIQILVEQLF
jgi:hypothetical protein